MGKKGSRKGRFQQKKKKKKQPGIFHTLRIPFLLLLTAAAGNILAWNFPAFSDWHRSTVFPLIQTAISRLSNRASFSVGEWMLGLGLPFLLILLLLSAIRRSRACFQVFFTVFSAVALEMTLTCFILYHCTDVGVRYLGYGSPEGAVYSFDEILSLREELSAEAVKLASQVERDEEGRPVYSGSLEEMKEEAVRSLQGLSEIIPETGGYSSIPKPLLSSFFLCQQSMSGYYFPFSMEANYNSMMAEINFPSCFCHELAHTRGFIREDEANYLSFLACVSSEDVFFRYSGVLSVINYTERAFIKGCGGKNERYAAYPLIPEQVKKDNVFLTEEVRRKVEEEAVVPTETVRKATDAYLDTALRANGIREGKLSYTGVVRYLLENRRCRGNSMEIAPAEEKAR